MNKQSINLDWVDDFIERIRPYVYVRETDNVLIRMPNEAFKLNKTGTKLVSHLLNGGKLIDIIEAKCDESDLYNQLSYFFTDLSLLLGSGFCDAYKSPALDRVPFELNYISLPILSELAVTYRCNIECQFCYAACRQVENDDREAMSEEELSAEEIKTLLRIIRTEAEVPSVSFTGGEPTLRPDLPELIFHASDSLRMRVNLITNGTLIDRRTAYILREAGLASAQVSIEAPFRELHDDITGSKGSFEASREGLLALKNAGVLVHPHTTLCSVNMPYIAQMAEFTRQNGFDRFSVNLVIPSGRGLSGDLAVHYSEVAPVVRSIMEEAKKNDVRFMWYSPTPVCLFNPIPHGLGNKGCSACEGLLSVDPKGNLLPCSSWTEPVGNLLNEGFTSLWFDKKAANIRDKQTAHPECRKCEHFAVCHGACPLYFKLHGYEEINQFLTTLKDH